MAEDNNEGKKEMTVIDHLEELRSRLVRGSIAVLVVAAVALYFVKDIFHYIILAPTRVDFITYKVFCEFSIYYAELWAKWFPDSDPVNVLCVEKLEFRMIATEPTEQF